jgi:hypothetical protein
MKLGLMRLTLFTLAVAVAACESPEASDNDARIIVPGEPNGAGIVYHDTRARLPYTVGDLIVCIDRPGRAVIDRIELKDPLGDLSLDAFAVIPNAMERGELGFNDDNRTIAEQGLLPDGPVVIDKPCPDIDSAPPDPTRTPQSVALLLQYSKPTEQTAGNHGIVIHYTSGGHAYSLPIQWEIMLCGPHDTTTELCAKYSPG